MSVAVKGRQNGRIVVSFSGKNLYRLPVVLLLAGSLATTGLSGCVTTQESRIGADDGSDACRAYVVALDSTGNYFAEDLLKGAAIGVAGGALVGFLATGNAQGALKGAVVGGVAGALGGYWHQLIEQGRDQAVLKVSADMQRENQQLDKTHQAFRQLSDCRRAEAARIKGQYANRAITRDEANRRLTLLAAQARKDLEILNNITGNADKRAGEFQYAAAQIDPSLPPPAAASTTGQSAAPANQAPAAGSQGSAAKSKKAKTPAPAARQPAAEKPNAPETTRQYASLQTKNTQLKDDGKAVAQDASAWEAGVS